MRSVLVIVDEVAAINQRDRAIEVEYPAHARHTAGERVDGAAARVDPDGVRGDSAQLDGAGCGSRCVNVLIKRSAHY